MLITSFKPSIPNFFVCIGITLLFFHLRFFRDGRFVNDTAAIWYIGHLAYCVSRKDGEFSKTLLAATSYLMPAFCLGICLLRGA